MNDHNYNYAQLCQLPNSNLSNTPLLCFREMPPVNLWPMGLFSINTKASTIATYLPLYFLSFCLSLPAFYLVSSNNKGSDDPLAFVGCKHLLCLCAGTANIVSVMPPTIR